ncbi:MAG: hypothetical protein ACI4S3_05770 [Candidatus Gastranaerophilaceae bacterium]
MSKIEKLNYFNRSKIKMLIPFLNLKRNNGFLKMLSISPFGPIHSILPLRYKFLDESYIITENDDALGAITVSPIVGNYTKLTISQLFFADNSYHVAKQLIDFVVSHYGANGASAFYVTFDETYTELMNLFISSCGFRQCSAEEIWEVPKKAFAKPNTIKYRRLKDSDLKEVSEIYNDSLVTYFKPTLERSAAEFSETFCHGLTYSTSYRYVIEDVSSSRLIGYFLVSTDDNENFLIDFNYSDGYNVDFEGIMYFAVREILKRKRHFKLFIKTKRYLKTCESQKNYFVENNFHWIKTKQVLVKDFYKLIKQETPLKEFIMLGRLEG